LTLGRSHSLSLTILNETRSNPGLTGATKEQSMAKTKSATITPLGDRLLVKRLEATEKTKGGIILPDSAKEKPREGTVIAAGPGKLLDSGERAAMTVKAKDHVLFSSYAGSEVKIDGEEYVILTEDEVLAVID
jgi:chaperonin GroES